MVKIYNLKNEILKVDIRQTGAELCAIHRLSDNLNYMWDANPAIWAGYAPVLFPIIGALKDDCYFYKGKKYVLPRHGFIRNNKKINILELKSDSITFSLISDEESLKIYPFDFEFLITYRLDGNSILVDHLVKNKGNKEMYFSLGGHPAFRCPLNSDEKYSDYYLEFPQNETAHTYQILPTGLIGEKTDLILDNSNSIKLHYNLFNKGALVFKSLKSKQVSLISKISGKRLQIDFEGFPYLGIWAKPNADYVCIEPWLGIADSVNTNKEFETKEGIIKLEANSSFSAGYTIRVF